MRRILIYIAAMTVLLSGCVREEALSPVVEEGRMVKTTLYLDEVNGDEITVTKADDSYSSLYSVLLFIYNSDGSYCESILSTDYDESSTDNYADGPVTLGDGSTSSTGMSYPITFTTSSGTKTILAIGNLHMSMWCADPDGNQSFSNYVQNELVTMAKGGSPCDSLEASIYYLHHEYVRTNSTPTVYTRMLVSGVQNGIVIDTDGDVSGNTDIPVTRNMAQIKFTFKAGSDYITYTPSSYEVHRIPQAVRLMETGVPLESDECVYFNKISSTLEGATVSSDGSISFDFFTPENIQDDVETCTNYVSREAWDHTYDGNGDKNWEYAPTDATYVVVYGSYDETDSSTGSLIYSGEASYTIHLGNFSDSGSYGNFSVERNTIYNYTVTVNGINSIVTEVTTTTGEEPQPGAEGDISVLDDDATIFILDAHFEQVLLTYDLTAMATEIEAKQEEDETIQETIGRSLQLVTKSPFQSEVQYIHPYLDYINNNDEDTSNDVDKETSLAGADYKWLELYPAINSSTTGTAGNNANYVIQAYPGTPSWKGNTNPTTNSGYLIDAYDLCVAMGRVIYKIINNETISTDALGEADGTISVYQSNGSYYTKLTGFVDEYYYTENPLDETIEITWNDFVDQDDRVIFISVETDFSEDENSSLSYVYTRISQHAIQTFYASEHASSLNAFGLETYNETPLTTYGSPRNSGTSDTYGRGNTATMVRAGNNVAWTTYLTTQYNGWDDSVISSNGSARKLTNAYTTTGGYAYAACMSRNRDLDGDGVIDDNEVLWYLPTTHEYVMLGIGTSALSTEALLYWGDKSVMTIDNYASAYDTYGARYYTSSASSSARVYWAVERGAYGSNEGYSLPIRCVRSLPGDLVSYNTAADEFGVESTTSDGNYIIDFRDHLQESLYRKTTITNGRFQDHNEDDDENRFYYAMVLPSGSNGYITGLTLYQIVNYGNGYNNYNPCGSYTETDDGSDLGAWRVPNLSELYIISEDTNYNPAGYGENSSTLLTCCTRFSNEDVRYGFFYNQGIITCLTPTSTPWTSTSYYIRCVRDATSEELAALDAANSL